MAAPSLRAIVISVLSNDAQISAWFPGGVLRNLPRVGTGQSVTPGAFFDATSTDAGILKDTIAVLDGGDDPSPGGAGQRGFVGYPLVYGFVQDSPAGDAKLDQLDEWLHAHFNRGFSYPRLDEAASGLTLKTLERQTIRDAEDYGYPGNVFAIWRIEGTYVRPPL